MKKTFFEQNDLEGVPPVGTEKYLQALRLLVNGVKDRSAGSGKKTAAVPGGYISGRGFRYYGYNHRFNKSNFEKEFKDRLYDWYNVRADRVFQQTVLTGPGWLQEPQLFANEPFLTPYSYTKELVGNEQPRFKESQIITDKYGRRIEIYEGVVVRRGNNIYHVSKTTHKVAMPDSINGGTAYRVYVNTEPGRRHYYVIDSRNKIVLNSEMDPTILYNNDFSSGSGGNHIIWNPGGYDAQKGPLRL